MAGKFGYLASDIHYGLSNFVAIVPSEERIREYAKQNKLAIDLGGKGQGPYIVPGSSLDELLEGMQLPVRSSDLVDRMDEFDVVDVVDEDR